MKNLFISLILSTPLLMGGEVQSSCVSDTFGGVECWSNGLDTSTTTRITRNSFGVMEVETQTYNWNTGLTDFSTNTYDPSMGW